VGLVIAFELSLAAIGWAIGWVLGHDALTGIDLSELAWRRHAMAAVWGLAAAAPMAALLVGADRLPSRSIRRLKRFVQRRLAPFFAHFSLLQMALVSLAAGIGEEVLFRGLIQEAIKARIGGGAGFAVALLIASLIFGVCHFLTPAYFVAAAVIGLYLGLLLEWTGDLTAPIMAHAAYDFFALWWMTRRLDARRHELRQRP
jgi:membrane protease YdiL (CAAX protease family)